MREAVLLARMVLEDSKAAMVLYGPDLPEEGLYFHADDDQALSDKMREHLKNVVKGMPDTPVTLDMLSRLLQRQGYNTVTRGVGATGKRKVARAYGSGMPMSQQAAGHMGMKPASALTVVGDPFGRGSRTYAGKALRGALAGEKPSKRALRGYVGFDGVNNPRQPAGFVVVTVEPASPAKDARIRRGDVITAGRVIEPPNTPSAYQDIRGLDDYMKFMRMWKSGQGVQFHMARGDKDIETPVIYPVPAARTQAV